jgi:hypothetical protein
MKLKLNKIQLKNLSNDDKVLPNALTPEVAGGRKVFEGTHYDFCETNGDICATNTVIAS